MLADIRFFLNRVGDDWDKASNGQRLGALIGGAVFMAFWAGLCAL